MRSCATNFDDLHTSNVESVEQIGCMQWCDRLCDAEPASGAESGGVRNARQRQHLEGVAGDEAHVRQRPAGPGSTQERHRYGQQS